MTSDEFRNELLYRYDCEENYISDKERQEAEDLSRLYRIGKYSFMANANGGLSISLTDQDQR